MDQSRVTAEFAYRQRLRNAEFWGRVKKRGERRKVKRQIICGAITWAAAYVIITRGMDFRPIYDFIGRYGLAIAVLVYGSRYLEWLLFPKDRPAKKPAPWDPEKAYNSPEPPPQ